MSSSRAARCALRTSMFVQSSASFRSSSAIRASAAAISRFEALELGRRALRRPRPRRHGALLGLAVGLRLFDRRGRAPLALHVGPAAVVRAQRAVLERDDPVGHGVEERAVVRDEEHGSRERLERGLERLARLDVEVVRRLVEDEEVRARRDEQREREPPALTARERGDRALVRLPAREEEPAEERLRLRARQPGRRGGRVEHRSARRAARARAARSSRARRRGRAGSSRRRADARRGSPRAASSCPSRSGRRARPSRRARSTIVASSSSCLSPAESATSSASRTIRPLRGGSRKSKPSVRSLLRQRLDLLPCAAERSFSRRAICVSFACACFAFDFL